MQKHFLLSFWEVLDPGKPLASLWTPRTMCPLCRNPSLCQRVWKGRDDPVHVPHALAAILISLPHSKPAWPGLSVLLGTYFLVNVIPEAFRSMWVEEVTEGTFPSCTSKSSICKTVRKDQNVNLIIICYKI